MTVKSKKNSANNLSALSVNAFSLFPMKQNVKIVKMYVHKKRREMRLLNNGLAGRAVALFGETLRDRAADRSDETSMDRSGYRSHHLGFTIKLELLSVVTLL